MSSRSLTLADGQLSVSNATLISGADVPAGFVSLLLSNTHSGNVTVTLTFRRAAGTARRLCKVTLEADEQLKIDNLPIQPDDSVLGFADIASVVDYLVSAPPGSGQLGIAVVGTDGATKREISGSAIISGNVDVAESPSLEDLMTEQNSILRRVLLALEMLHGSKIPDPA